MKILTGAELKFAAWNKVPVHYVEKYFNPMDRHMNFSGKCVMEKAPVGFYIGNSDIDPNTIPDSSLAEGEFPEGTWKVCRVAGKSYSKKRK